MTAAPAPRPAPAAAFAGTAAKPVVDRADPRMPGSDLAEAERTVRDTAHRNGIGGDDPDIGPVVGSGAAGTPAARDIHARTPGRARAGLRAVA